MQITSTNQPDKDKPQFADPVHALFNMRVFYATDDGVIDAGRRFKCDRVFAVTVLEVIEKWCLKYGFGMVHLGCYNPRFARHKNGTEITPRRWSNHAYGLAIDFKGIKDNNGKYISFEMMETACPAKLHELIGNIKTAIVAKGRKPELVNEGQWLHLGIWK